MEGKLVLVLGALLAVLCAVSEAMSLPSADRKHNQLQEFEEYPEVAKGDSEEVLDESDRATWLDTRNLEDEFKELVYLAVAELENEGRLNGVVAENQMKEKRGRWQGFCFRRTRSGRFLPYICWKGEGQGEAEA